MKRLSIAILILMLAFDVSAQSLHNKILVVLDTAFHGVGPMLPVASQFYTGQIEVTNYIPSDLSEYDAILLEWNRMLTDSESEARLIDYLKLGGKIYLQGSEANLRVNGEPDTLMKFCGVSRPGPVSMVAVRFNAIHSTESEFTDGLDTAWTRQNPVDYDLDQPWGLDGSLVSLLCAQEEGFSNCDPIAWRPADISIHAVIYWTILPELYDKFIQRTLCNDFGLCNAADVHPRTTSALTIKPNPAHTTITISLSEERESSIEIADVLGNVLLRKQAMGELHWNPENATAAVYFVRVSTSEANGMTSVSTQRVVFER